MGATSGTLMLSWVAMGRVYPVVEWPRWDKSNPLAPAPGDERTRACRPAMPGYDSHYVLVHKEEVFEDDEYLKPKIDKKTGKVMQDHNFGWPCLPDQAIDGDELCVFRKEQVRSRAGLGLGGDGVRRFDSAVLWCGVAHTRPPLLCGSRFCPATSSTLTRWTTAALVSPRRRPSP